MNEIIHLSIGHDEAGYAYVYRFASQDAAETFNRMVRGMDVDMTFEYVPIRGVMQIHQAIGDLKENRS